jgi:hypothetical protein
MSEVQSDSIATVTIRVSGKLFVGHLAYLEQLVESAADCGLWPVLSLANLNELDRAAVFYLVNGEGRDFGIVSCPNFIQEWMHHEKSKLITGHANSAA